MLITINGKKISLTLIVKGVFLWVVDWQKRGGRSIIWKLERFLSLRTWLFLKNNSNIFNVQGKAETSNHMIWCLIVAMLLTTLAMQRMLGLPIMKRILVIVSLEMLTAGVNEATND